MSMNPRKGILSLKISDQNMLYHSYMPFLKNGGLFIPTSKEYQMGEEVFILLNLMDEPEKISVATTSVSRFNWYFSASSS